MARVRQIESRLNAVRAPARPLRVEIVNLDAPVAFTIRGRFVYLARSWLERLRSDDAIAFVIAHEMAHHDLGHLPRGWVSRVASDFERSRHPYVHELQADRLAVLWCRDARFDTAGALAVIDLLLRHRLPAL